MPVVVGRSPVQMEARDGLADRGVAVGVGEKDATFREGVDVRGIGIRVPPEAADPVIEIVDREEKKIGAVFGLGRGEKQDEGKKTGLSFFHGEVQRAARQ